MNDLAIIKKFNEFEAAGEFLQAKELLIEHYGALPKDQKMSYRLGICELRLDEYKAAEKLFQNGKALGAEIFQTFFWPAVLSNETGNYLQAITELTKSKPHIQSENERNLVGQEYVKACHGLAAELGISLWQANDENYDKLIHQLGQFQNKLQASIADVNNKLDDSFLLKNRQSIITEPFILTTNHPIAFESDDHLFPRGTAEDNTRSPRFVKKAEQIIGNKPIRHMDLGCAGGGLVYEFLINDHHSIGLEGSDFSKKAQRAAWRVIPDYLQTCDITKPFKISDNHGNRAQFDLITAWEVLEHINENDIPQLLKNIYEHLNDDGLFVASVAQFEDFDPVTGAQWHVTLKSYEWWKSIFEQNKLHFISSPFMTADYVRGSGNPYNPGDWDAINNPELGFHIVAKK